jgi:2-haloacid dehalogenase
MKREGFTRRELLDVTAGGVAGALLARPAGARAAGGLHPGGIAAVAFDGFPIIDPRPIGALAEHLFAAKGAELMTTWRTRQFEYTWLRTLSGRYVDFWKVTEDALVFAAKAVKLALSGADRDALMGAYLKLRPWPDVAPALGALKRAGLRLAFLSNFTPRMLDAALEGTGLRPLFEEHLSVERVRAYKPDPRAYRMALEALELPPERIAFVASAAWDVAGAKWFGYPTVWVNRMAQPPEELGVAADATFSGLDGVVDFVLQRPRPSTR